MPDQVERDPDANNDDAALNQESAPTPAGAEADEDGKGERHKTSRYHQFCEKYKVKKKWVRFRRHGPQWIEAGCAIALVVITGSYTYYASQQAGAAITAAGAAKKSADVAETTLIATNRPWLDLDAHLAGPLTLNEQGEARIVVEVKTENIGHSPAVSVSDAQSMIQVILLTPNPWHELRKVCDQATTQSTNPHNRGVTETIFPGKPYQQSINLGLSKQELARSINDTFPTAGRDPSIHPAIIWCVAYQAAFSDVPHRTGYVWELKRRTPRGIVDIDRNTTVPLSDLVLERSWPVPPFAD